MTCLLSQPFRHRCVLAAHFVAHRHCGSIAATVRQIADLPCSGQPVRLFVQVRKCFCEVTTCTRKIFTERLTPFVEPWARVTRRLYQIVQVIGLATGGRLGVRVTDRLGIQTKRQTILRRIMALPTDPVGQVIELGIDDFAFRNEDENMARSLLICNVTRSSMCCLIEKQKLRCLDSNPPRN